MFGPPETPYVGGEFKVTIDLSDVILYEKIPKVRVVTPIFHPDISQHKTANETNNQHDFGEICVQFFCHDDMRSRRDVPHILDRLRQLLFDPIGEYPPNYPAYSLLWDDCEMKEGSQKIINQAEALPSSLDCAAVDVHCGNIMNDRGAVAGAVLAGAIRDAATDATTTSSIWFCLGSINLYQRYNSAMCHTTAFCR